MVQRDRPMSPTTRRNGSSWRILLKNSDVQRRQNSLEIFSKVDSQLEATSTPLRAVSAGFSEYAAPLASRIGNGAHNANNFFASARREFFNKIGETQSDSYGAMNVRFGESRTLSSAVEIGGSTLFSHKRNYAPMRQSVLLWATAWAFGFPRLF